jgi:hypothetical protein
MRPLLDRAQAVLLLLADLLRVVRLPAAALLPLLRTAMVALTVEGQKLLQEKAVRLLVAAFQACPSQVGCGLVWWSAGLFCSVLCCAVLCCALLCYAVLCCAVLCCAVWCAVPCHDKCV